MAWLEWRVLSLSISQLKNAGWHFVTSKAAPLLVLLKKYCAPAGCARWGGRLSRAISFFSRAPLNALVGTLRAGEITSFCDICSRSIPSSPFTICTQVFMASLRTSGTAPMWNCANRNSIICFCFFSNSFFSSISLNWALIIAAFFSFWSLASCFSISSLNFACSSSSLLLASVGSETLSFPSNALICSALLKLTFLPLLFRFRCLIHFSFSLAFASNMSCVRTFLRMPWASTDDSFKYFILCFITTLRFLALNSSCLILSNLASSLSLACRLSSSISRKRWAAYLFIKSLLSSVSRNFR